MLAKLTSKNQLTLPKAIVQQIDQPEYFDVSLEDGRIVLTPMSFATSATTSRKKRNPFWLAMIRMCRPG
jgi:hypothetical protein